MPYVPPVGSAIHFYFLGGYYSPPNGGTVNMIFPPDNLHAYNKNINIPFEAKVDTNFDTFNQASTFNAIYLNDSSGLTTPITGSFSEIIKTVPGNTAITSSITPSGITSIQVSSGHTLSQGDTFSTPTNEYYYITSTTTTSLTIKSPTTTSIPSSSTLTQRGNTGVYTIQVTISLPGDYTIIVDNPTINMQSLAFPVTVVAETLNDAHTKIDILSYNLGTKEGKVYYKCFT